MAERVYLSCVIPTLGASTAMIWQMLSTFQWDLHYSYCILANCVEEYKVEVPFGSLNIIIISKRARVLQFLQIEKFGLTNTDICNFGCFREFCKYVDVTCEYIINSGTTHLDGTQMTPNNDIKKYNLQCLLINSTTFCVHRGN